MKRRYTLLRGMAVLLATLPLAATAAVWAEQRPTPSDLPSAAAARQGIEQTPTVIEARGALEAIGHGAAAVRAGPYEWSTRLSAQRRHYDGGSTSTEWSAAIERPLRIGGKADLDAELGDADVAIGQARLNEARLVAARTLVELWFDLQAAHRQRELWNEQLRFAQDSHRAVETRHRAGDASLLDLNVARADLIEVQRQVSAAGTAVAKAQARLALHFPGMEQAPVVLTEPAALAWDLAQWRDRILACSATIKAAEGLLRKAELSATRARADRLPDPTVGIYTASEAFRKERIVGLSVSIPLSGTYRNERMLQALQEAEAARAVVERQRREETASVTDAYVDATGSLERWRLAALGLTTTRDSSRLTQRAYSLGEADLQTLLLARRQSLDAAAAAEQARVEALRTHYRLLVDAHLIWQLEDH